MERPEVFNKLEPYLQQMLREAKTKNHVILISGKPLTPHEAIGSPDRNDFPLLKGKEKLMQASVEGYIGQAYTDQPDDFQGKLEEILSLSPTNNFKRAVIVATLNAVMRKRGLVSGTIHCKDTGPTECSVKLVEKIKSEYGQPKVAMFGYQPAMVDMLTKNFTARVFDLDPDNTGRIINGVKIESGICDFEEVAAWCDLILVTGSTVVNGTIDSFLNVKKPVIFYGTTIAGVAATLGLKRFCPVSL